MKTIEPCNLQGSIFLLLYYSLHTAIYSKTTINIYYCTGNKF